MGGASEYSEPVSDLDRNSKTYLTKKFRAHRAEQKAARQVAPRSRRNYNSGSAAARGASASPTVLAPRTQRLLRCEGEDHSTPQPSVTVLRKLKQKKEKEKT